ncbi:PorT family protein [Halosquirtibacter xylanolyticus]|uniref:porin family protein n=1 Tax=Halosquirtibacter xylanolyticus TaxID=3374599 RepID=UPI003748D899|nr:PorT family protein [Prolixibacteraceae bacterium]
MRNVILICVCICSSFIASAQDNMERGKITLGLRVGVNESFYYVSGSPDGRMRNGLVEGLYMNYALSEKFSLQTELYFVQTGSFGATDMSGTYEDSSMDTPISYDYTLTGESSFKNNYLALPILFCYHFGDSPWKVFGGFRFGLLLSSNHDWEGELVVMDEQGENLAPNVVIDNLIYDKYEKVDFKQMDYSISLGVHYKVRNLPLGIDLRTTYGLNDVNKNTTEEHDNWMKNGGIQFSVTYDLWKSR